MSSDLQKEFQTSYLSGGSMDYLDSLYEDYLKDKTSVPKEWQDIFKSLPSIDANVSDVSHQDIKNYFLAQKNQKSQQLITADVKQAKVAYLINAYRTYGHLIAKLDPLEMIERPKIPVLELEYHGLSKSDLKETFFASESFSHNEMTLEKICEALQAIYCGSIGIEYMHIANIEETKWLQHKMESTKGDFTLSSEKKIEVLKELIETDSFERYLGTRYVGQKRFSVEGGDSIIPMLKEVLNQGGSQGVKEVVIGMAHRGRLNVLVNVLGQNPTQMFQAFEGKNDSDRTGDVKYHLGYSSNLRTDSGAIVHTSLAFNPSHLEIIGPVVQGSVRSRLRRLHDLADKNKVLPVVIHGDAAFSGQGVVMETFNFSQSRGYNTGGTIHIVINNQIGFTTSNPLDARSTLYCTDVAKMVQAPVIHVNGDDPEAVVFATKIAFEFRMKFKRDVVVDLVCYRRHGHNEADEPSITQPLMYKKIKKMPTLREKYTDKLISEGLISKEKAKEIADTYRDKLDKGQKVVETIEGNYEGRVAIDWKPYIDAKWTDKVDTSVSDNTIQLLSEKLLSLPENFTLHPVVAKLLQERAKMSQGKTPINWGYAETMAYATLLYEGYPVRLSGQDSARGTFAHRHSVLYNLDTGETYTPLQHISCDENQSFSVIDSVLSEEAVLAFEYGYAASEPTSLVIWEAQFGDFANGAQVVIDQFISSGEQKWGRLCGLVMMLPHGYEGQGPEHSSARLERFMQLCAQHNIQVATPTTPAQIFHLLRRQVIRKFRKPLIIMTPKSLLRHKLAVSSLENLTSGGFKTVIPEVDSLNSEDVVKIVLCCGKVYYDLLEKRREEKLKSVAIIRIEQLYPFPTKTLAKEIAKYPNVKTVIWCQEEPQNQGVWFSSQHNIRVSLGKHQTLNYAGRPFAAAPATGSATKHMEEQSALVREALKG